MLKVILLILAAEVWGVTGQILYKKSVNRVDSPNLRSFTSFLNFVKSVFGLPSFWLGLLCISAGMVVWLAALALTDLSIAFPIDSMQYILMLIAARIFLGEKMHWEKLLGTLLVVGGIVLVALS